ncbi:MAG: HutD family protein [Tissierellia bacterium]|nr:HutD family protein [Tissierellia bacterium]
MSIRKLTKDDFITSDWSGGTTTQVYIEPENSSVAEQNFDFRISTATCELDESPFTPYNDYNRFITPLDGIMRLVNGEEEVKLNPYDIYAFGGEDPVTSYGKVRDFNLIVNKDKYGSLRRVKFNDEFDFDVGCSTCIIFTMDSGIEFTANGESFVLNKMDAVIIKNENVNIKLKAEDKATVLIATVS